MANLSERLEGELRGKNPAEVTILNLDHTPSGGNLENSGLTDNFKALRKLSLNGVGLTTLKQLPVLPSLRKLELADNRLMSTLERLPAACKQLAHLNIANNRFKDVAALDALKHLPALRVLNVESNPVANDANYRKALFALIPSLQYVDDEDREGNSPSDEGSSDEEEEGDEEGEEGEEGDDAEEGDAGEGEDEGDAGGDDQEGGEDEGDVQGEEEGEAEEGEEGENEGDDEDDEGEYEPQAGAAEGEEEEGEEEEEDDDDEEEDTHQAKRSKTH